MRARRSRSAEEVHTVVSETRTSENDDGEDVCRPRVEHREDGASRTDSGMEDNSADSSDDNDDFDYMPDKMITALGPCISRAASMS
jgi:hypothetical protein